jgi:hypothetical protein
MNGGVRMFHNLPDIGIAGDVSDGSMLSKKEFSGNSPRNLRSNFASMEG